MLVVAPEPPRQPEVLQLLAVSDAESASRYPPQSRHGVGLDVLERDACRFVVARQDGVAVGCGGVLLDGRGQAEVKRLFVAAAARGCGVARRIMEVLEGLARAEQVRLLQLETGIASHAALGLYLRLGFRECGRFGDYRPDRLSVFMEKPL